MTSKINEANNNKYWLDQPKNIALIIWSLVVVCVLLFFADAFYQKHAHFEIENLFGFYGLYGFFVCVALVLVAKYLRTILMRSEDYYDLEEKRRNSSNTSHQAHD